MVTAVTKLGVDAAIIFSDLLPILEPMGLDLEFAKGEGPVIHNPIREIKDIERIMELESVESLDFVMETVKQTRLELPADMPLIGLDFGAPFTLASYAIEGGSSRNYLNTKTIMYRDEGAWKELMLRFVTCNYQIPKCSDCCRSTMRPALRFLGRLLRHGRLPSVCPTLHSGDHRGANARCSSD